jgi:hypothetical protein
MPKFSYIPAAHVKLKADNIVTVLICVLRQIWLYLEGWTDSRRRRNREDEDRKEGERARKQMKKRKALGKASRKVGKGKMAKIIAKGRYTLLLQ